MTKEVTIELKDLIRGYVVDCITTNYEVYDLLQAVSFFTKRR
jgi:hypothetical protein